MSRKFVLHDGKRGSALAVRITPRAEKNQILGMLNDGTIKVQLAGDPGQDQSNVDLIIFLAEILGVPASKLEVVAGETGRDKLVSILDMDVKTAHERVLEHIN